MAIEDELLKDDHTITISRSTVEVSEEKLIGTVFAGKYQLIECLGRGGMSTVYKARHLAMDKLVAVKVLLAHLSEDEQSVRRFQQEAQAASALTHPGIVAVHDFGEDANGTPFLVMDLIEGESLSQSIKSHGPLNVERFLTIMQQVASALDHAHRRGVVHRDLKPSNIMLSKNNEQEFARIVDFGIAKIVTHGSDAKQQLTQTGELFGSPLYMSPEQCSGSPLDKRSDIYALGCVMYESLTGKPPYMGDTVYETINKQMNETPPALVAAQLDEDVKEKLELIVLKCLAKQPEQRYQNAADIEPLLKSISLQSRTGVFSKIGRAWELVNAKSAARRRSKIPMLVIGLTTVSCFSMISTLCLLGAFIDSDQKAKQLAASRKVLTEYSLIQVDLGHMGRLGEMYVMQERTPEVLEKWKSYRKSLAKRLDIVQDALNFDPQQKEAFDDKRPQMDQLLNDTLDLMTSMGPNLNLTDYATGLTLKMKEREALDLVSDLGTEAKHVEKQEAKIEQARTFELYLSILCVFLNALVMISLLFYFARGTPKRLKKLVEQASRFSSKKHNEAGDEIAELDQVIQDLATALSEAEEREKALLHVIEQNVEAKNPSS